MINYGHVFGTSKPSTMEILDNCVFIASNIRPYEKLIDGHLEQGYEYDYVGYTTNEYICELQEQVLNTQEALSELYELIEGDL